MRRRDTMFVTTFCGTSQRRLFSLLVFVASAVTFVAIRNSIETVQFSLKAQALRTSSNNKGSVEEHSSQIAVRETNKWRTFAQLFSVPKGRETEKERVASEGSSSFNEDEIIVKIQEQAKLIQQLQKTIQDCGSKFIVDTQRIFEKQEETKQQKFYSQYSATSSTNKQHVVATLQQQTNIIKLLHQQLEDQKAIIAEISEEFQNAQEGYITQSNPIVHSSPGLTAAAPQQSSAGMTSSHVGSEAVLAETAGNSLPKQSKKLAGYADSSDPLMESDTPVFWHIPKAGGSVMKDIMGACHRLVLATEAGILDGHDTDTELAVVQIGGDPANGIEPSKFVNLDTTHKPGLEKAKQLGLVQSGLADVIVIRHLFEAEELFHPPQQRGRVFTIFRHPVDRSISMFNYIKFADWEPTYSAEIARMTLEDYVHSPFMEQDWITRYLSNTMTGPLKEEHFELAKDTLRRKVMVGLLEKKEESMERFEKFFGWKYKSRPKVQEECRTEYLGGGVNSNTHSQEKPQPGTPLYDSIAHMNKFDIRLYSYIQELFVEQAKFTAGLPDGYRLQGATCCECNKTC